MNEENIDNTKIKIINSATKLLRTRSYNAFSYNDIANEIGIRKSSIHYYFPSKDTLGVAAVKNYMSKVKYLVEKLEKRNVSSWQKLDEYFNFFRSGLKADMICPGGVLTVEFNTLNKDMQDELQILFLFYINWLTDLLTEGKKIGAFNFNKKPKDLALFFASTIEGGLIFARAFKDEEYFENIVEKLKDMIKL